MKGTINFLPPELLYCFQTQKVEGKFYPVKIDIFALGIILINLILGKNIVKKIFHNLTWFENKLLYKI